VLKLEIPITTQLRSEKKKKVMDKNGIALTKEVYSHTIGYKETTFFCFQGLCYLYAEKRCKIKEHFRKGVDNLV